MLNELMLHIDDIIIGRTVKWRNVTLSPYDHPAYPSQFQLQIKGLCAYTDYLDGCLRKCKELYDGGFHKLSPRTIAFAHQHIQRATILRHSATHWYVAVYWPTDYFDGKMFTEEEAKQAIQEQYSVYNLCPERNSGCTFPA